MLGLLDRFEGEKAVILVEEKNREWIVEKSRLPDGSEKGSWLSFEENEGELSHFQIESDLTKEKKETAADLLQSIRLQSKGSKFKRKP